MPPTEIDKSREGESPICSGVAPNLPPRASSTIRRRQCFWARLGQRREREGSHEWTGVRWDLENSKQQSKKMAEASYRPGRCLCEHRSAVLREDLVVRVVRAFCWMASAVTSMPLIIRKGLPGRPCRPALAAGWFQPRGDRQMFGHAMPIQCTSRTQVSTFVQFLHYEQRQTFGPREPDALETGKRSATQ